MKAIIVYEGEVVSNLPTFEVDDFGAILTFHIINEDGSAFDLTGQTVSFKAKKLNDFDEYLIDSSCTITDDEAGYCTYIFASSDLSEDGSFSCTLEITKALTNQYSISLGYLNVNEDN